MGKTDSGYTINTSLAGEADIEQITPLPPIPSSHITHKVNSTPPIPAPNDNYIFIPNSGMDPGSVDPSTDYNFKAGK